MKQLDSLKREVIEEGRGHPFVEALVRTLDARYQALHQLLENQAAAGVAKPHNIHSTGGRAAEVAEIIRLITKTEGRDE